MIWPFIFNDLYLVKFHAEHAILTHLNAFSCELVRILFSYWSAQDGMKSSENNCQFEKCNKMFSFFFLHFHSSCLMCSIQCRRVFFSHFIVSSKKLVFLRKSLLITIHDYYFLMTYSATSFSTFYSYSSLLFNLKQTNQNHNQNIIFHL